MWLCLGPPPRAVACKFFGTLMPGLPLNPAQWLKRKTLVWAQWKQTWQVPRNPATRSRITWVSNGGPREWTMRTGVDEKQPFSSHLLMCSVLGTRFPPWLPQCMRFIKFPIFQLLVGIRLPGVSLCRWNTPLVTNVTGLPAWASLTHSLFPPAGVGP